MNQYGSFFESYMPLGQNFHWLPDILWLNVVSDALIALACFAIPITLLIFLRRRPGMLLRSGVMIFCLFMFVCGVAHLISISTVWHGHYGVHGVAKAFTALASLATAVVLFQLLPKLLALRSPDEIRHANAVLEERVEQYKRSEIQSIKLQGELARIGRITTVGQMASGLAHELNQPLLVISACADTASQVARRVVENDPVLFECLQDIQAETQRAGEIVRTLRQFVSAKSSARKPQDLNQLVNQAVRLMGSEAHTIGARIIVNAGDIPEVSLDRVQIAQVLVNLIRNAVEAISGESRSEHAPHTITIETTLDNGMVAVTVSDTGPGLASDVDPFAEIESNKNYGLGVGLPISRNIVESHGGVLSYHSDLIGGAAFTFSLPVSAMQVHVG